MSAVLKPKYRKTMRQAQKSFPVTVPREITPHIMTWHRKKKRGGEKAKDVTNSPDLRAGCGGGYFIETSHVLPGLGSLGQPTGARALISRLETTGSKWAIVTSGTMSLAGPWVKVSCFIKVGKLYPVVIANFSNPCRTRNEESKNWQNCLCWLGTDNLSQPPTLWFFLPAEEMVELLVGRREEQNTPAPVFW